MDKIAVSNLLGITGALVSDKPLVLEVANLPENLKTGMILFLSDVSFPKIMNDANLFQINLQSKEGENVVLDVKSTNLYKLETLLKSEQKIFVKLMPDGNLQVQIPKKDVGTIDANVNIFGREVSKLSQTGVTQLDINPVKVEMQPVKIFDSVEKIMAEMNLPLQIRKSIAEILDKVEVVSVLKDIGVSKEPVNSILLPLKETMEHLKTFRGSYVEVAEIQQRLVQDIKDLVGKTFVGFKDEIVSEEGKVFFNSSLGKIWSETAIKIPEIQQSFIFEVVKVDIAPHRELLPLINFFSAELEKVWPKEMAIQYEEDLLMQLINNKENKPSSIVNIIKPLIELRETPELMLAVLQKISGLKPDI